MTTHKKFFASKQAGAIAFTAGLILAVTGSVFASSIGSSLSVSGTAGVTGLSTFTGAFISQASSTVVGVLNVSGAVSASSTLSVSGLATLGTGFIGQASSTVDGTLTVSGAISASSSLVVLRGILSQASSTVNGLFVVVPGSLTTLGGGVISQASSTVVGNFSIDAGGGGLISRLSIGSSTPSLAATAIINGSLMVASSTLTATTTITISSGSPASSNKVGGCINLRATDGTMMRIYATTSPVAAQSYSNLGSNASGEAGTGYHNLVVEAGSCQ